MHANGVFRAGVAALAAMLPVAVEVDARLTAATRSLGANALAALADEIAIAFGVGRAGDTILGVVRGILRQATPARPRRRRSGQLRNFESA